MTSGEANWGAPKQLQLAFRPAQAVSASLKVKQTNFFFLLVKYARNATDINSFCSRDITRPNSIFTVPFDIIILKRWRYFSSVCTVAAIILQMKGPANSYKCPSLTLHNEDEVEERGWGGGGGRLCGKWWIMQLLWLVDKKSRVSYGSTFALEREWPKDDNWFGKANM